MLHVGLAHYLVVAAGLFSLGAFCVVTRRNAVGILMGIELILNAANINFVAFNHFSATGLHGQVFAVFGIVLAAAEAAVGLAIVLSIYQGLRTIDVSQASQLKD
jgi:NADH-quinone oxidoreductase subunit K